MFSYRKGSLVISRLKNSREISKSGQSLTLVVVKSMRDLIQQVVAVSEETQQPPVDLYRLLIVVLIHVKRTDEEVLHPVVFDLINGHLVTFHGLGFFLNDGSQFEPDRPEAGEHVQHLYEDFFGLFLTYEQIQITILLRFFRTSPYRNKLTSLSADCWYMGSKSRSMICSSGF
jgi:hypothetical protein